ncbi:MAG: TolC family protein [Candidatus Firestonebacteria bacterium]|nr:TolC family protein [Candidatus Firestonebacteria bacterium]
MNIKIVFFSILFVIYIPLSSITAEESVSLYDIPVCINMALKNSRKTIINQQKIIEAREKVEEVKSQFYPNVNASLLYSRLEKAPTIDFGGKKTKVGDENTYNAKLQVIYPLYTAGATKIGTEISEMGLEYNEVSSQITRLDIIYAVYQNYFNVLKAYKFAEIALESINLLKAHEKNIQNLFALETATKIDLLTIQVKIAEAEQILVKVQNAIKISETSFNQLLGRDMDSSMVLKDYKEKPNFSLKYEDCLSSAYSNRIEIKTMNLAIKIEEKIKALTATEDKPKVSLIGAYNIDEGGLTKDKKWTVSLSANFPIWDHNKTEHKILQEQSKLEQNRLQLLELKDGIALQVKQAYLNAESIGKEIETSKLAIEQASENYKMTEEKYKENLITNTEVLDAHTMLIKANINYYSALYDFQLALAGLRKAMGIFEEITSHEEGVNYAK